MSKSSDLAYQKIKEEIKCGRLAPGEQLKEESLANLCQVSRTPVREALRRLESELIVKKANTGRAFVMHWSATEIREIFFLRAMLEGYAVELAIKEIGKREISKLKSFNTEIRAAIDAKPKPNVELFVENNWNFHKIIVDASSSERLKLLIYTLVEQPILHRIALSFDRKGMETSLHEHEELVRAIIKKDAVWARDIMSSHIRRAYHTYIDSVLT